MQVSLGWSMLAIAAGASLGALLRWALAVGMNAWWAPMPPGTLAANLIGGYLIGVVLAWLLAHPGVSPLWRLFLVTGFLGGLTTFSTFSAEVVHNLQQGRLLWALITSATHLLGSLAMTALGFATVQGWRSGS